MYNKQQLIVTTCDRKYEDNLLNDFLPSLRKEGEYNGQIIVLDYGLDHPEKVEQYGATAKKCNRLPNYSETVDVLRPMHILEVIHEHPEVEYMGHFDSGDVWFQGSINPMFGHTGFCMAKEGSKWTEPWCLNVLASVAHPVIQQTWRAKLHDKIMLNAGIYTGDVKSIKRVMEEQIAYVAAIGKTFFGLDQTIYNYLWYDSKLVNAVELDCGYNFVTQARKWVAMGDKIFAIEESGNRLIPVVHNAGARVAPRLYKKEK